MEGTADPRVHVTQEDGVAYVSLNRPKKRNAFDLIDRRQR